MRTRPKIREVPRGKLVKMCNEPMTEWEVQRLPGWGERGDPALNEKWLETAFVNSRYAVQCSVVATAVGEVMHLWIKRHDGEMPRSWRDMQRIKSEIVGPERTAVEVFPPESEVVDHAPMAHLWVFPKDFVIPFTLHKASLP